MEAASPVTSYLKDVRGIALMEFALILPLFLILSLGVIELAHFLQFREKLESSANQMLDIVNQNTNVTGESLDNLYRAFPLMMRPYDMDDPPRILVTQIERPPFDPECKPVVSWQYPLVGGSNIAPNIGGFANTGDITMAPGDHLIAIEVFAPYVPLINNGFTRNLFSGNRSTYIVHYQHTRYGAFRISPNTGQVVTAPCVR
jgi:Flp pilus assembly protein TadG